jgi:hypothetical protein
MDWLPEPSGDRGTISFSDLQNVTNFDRMPRRNVLERWLVFYKMAELDDMVWYISTKKRRSVKLNAHSTIM